ncbi:hypothetical protein SUDANB121_04440 [Nocardiopsis dassonvillei]|uniref:DoxX family protein n=1 Tax=Nocardiopsis dassonvillei TaxID=2014 RepID=UPI003F572680
MNTALWIAAGLLAFVAFTGGVSKTFMPIEKLSAAPGGSWTGHAHPALVRTLGVLQLLAAFGFLLPPLVGVLPVMVPVTAVCWILLMFGAMATHLRFDGVSVYILLNTVYLSLAVFLLWGRLVAAPFGG